MYQDLLDVQGTIRHTAQGHYSRFALPPSYLSFVRELGYGRLCGLFIVYIPFDQPHTHHPDTLSVQNDAMRSTFQEYLELDISMLEDPVCRDLVTHAEPFGISENGHFLFWDTRAPTGAGEYPIYLADFPVGIYPAGDSLVEFIKIVTDPVRFQSVLRFSNAPRPASFYPFPDILD